MKGLIDRPCGREGGWGLGVGELLFRIFGKCMPLA